MVNTRHGSVTHQSHDGENIDSVWSLKAKKAKGASASAGSSPLKFLDVDDDDTDFLCKVCPKMVGNKGVQCDRCTGWVHVQCSDLSREEYDYLSRIASEAVQYLCPPCRKQIKEGINRQDRTAIQEAKIDQLTKIVGQLQQQNINIMNLLNKNDNIIQESTKEVQVKMEEVKVKMNEALIEEKEKEKRKNNIIISNVKESSNKDSGERQRDDRETVTDILRSIVDIEEPEVENVVRLGGKTDKDGKTRQKPRLLKVMFTTEAKKREVMKKARGLNEGVEEFERKIFINNDETEAERKAGYELRQKLREKKKATGEQDWVIRNGEIVKRKQASYAEGATQEEEKENQE